MKPTRTGEQVVAGIINKDDEHVDDNVEYVWLASALTKNFNSDKVNAWASRIKNGAKAYFKYTGKKSIPYGSGFQFNAEWVKS